MFVGVTGFIATAAVNSQTNLLFWTFGLMLGVLIVSVVVSGLSMMGLRLKRLLPDHGAAGEPLVIRYELQSRNWILPAFGLTITELDGWRDGAMSGAPQGWAMHIGPRASLQAEAIGWPMRRGLLKFDRVRIFTTFPFGILRRSVTFWHPGTLVVYPQLHRLRRNLLEQIKATDPAGTRASQQGGGSEEFFGLREYRPGDSLRMIDWKHAARFGRLVSRDLTRVTPPKMMVLLDLRGIKASEHEAAERAISFAASLICEAHLDGFEVGLAAAGVAMPVFTPHHSRFHRTRLLHALGELDLYRTHANIWSPPASRNVNWVVVHPGAIDRAMGPAASLHIGPVEMEQWHQPTVSAPAGATPPSTEPNVTTDTSIAAATSPASAEGGRPWA